MSYKVFHIDSYSGNANKNFLGIHLTPVMMAKIKKTMVNAIEDVRKADTSSLLVQCKGGVFCVYWGNLQ